MALYSNILVMKNYWFVCMIFLVLLSCHKEEPFDFSYTTNPAHEDVFRHMKFDCQEVNGPVSFVGTVDGHPYCLFDTNLTEIRSGMFTLISTPDPIINPYNDSSAVSTGYQCWILPKKFKAGDLALVFSYNSGGLIGFTKEDFFNEYFVPGVNLPLSTSNTTSPPNEEGRKGVVFDFVVYDGFQGVRRGYGFTTSDIFQPEDAYVKCIRSEKIEPYYYIELDVNLMLPSRSRFDDLPEPEMKNIKGRLVMQIPL